ILQADTILDVEITPNRPDLLSHYGLAREIAALTGTSLRTAPPAVPETKQDGGVRISALRECPFYSARRIENVTVRPSPDWLRAKLESAGLRPINNIVDITNYVMLELGQPLHAFDADKLQGGINVRLAREGEKFLALDGREYTLTNRDLMIADEARAVGIGGVMGGEDTGVTEATRTALLEAAWFLPASIRRTARTLNLPSDASYRFERGVDPGMTLRASARAAELMRELAGGTPAAETAVAGAPPIIPADVTLRYERCNDLLGVTIAPDEVQRVLRAFGLEQTSSSAEFSSWKIPSFRPDLRREVDLIEEVVRAYGVEKVPSSDRSRFTPETDADRQADFENSLRQRLVGFGLNEVRTSALVPRNAANGAVELRNPLSEDHVALRPSLERGLLSVLTHNLNMGAESVRFFEIGNIFAPPDARERRAVGLLFAGSVSSSPHWRDGAKRQLDFFDLKGAIDALGVRQLEFRRTSDARFSLAVEILSAGEVIGVAGQLSGSTGYFAEIDLGSIAATRTAARFSEIEKYPASTRDIAMIVPERVTHAQVMAVIGREKEPLLTDVRLFDVFAGSDAANIGAGRKSLAYTLTYRDRNRTLTNDEVAVVHTRIRERLKRELGAELRE
ncbi:MAG TPA: phenylalanine--tRNA ligase subunit beta, partial [Chthoniobacterales bacterium]|nr:phenylalanine--tRNA ligase subunit beta [Chthoniobacterales bacterium]